MSPALLPGELIFVNKLAYGFRFPPSGASSLDLKNPKRGELVLFSIFGDDKKDYVKRVIGLSGDKISIQNSIVVLNGKKISQLKKPNVYEEALKNDGADMVYEASWDKLESMPEVEVPEKSLFVLGDNRKVGKDSRHWGFLPLNNLKGRVSLIWFSREKGRMLTRVR